MTKCPLSYVLLVSLVSVLLLSLGACRSSKSSYTGDVSALDASTASPETLFEGLADSYSAWSDLYVPVTLSLESPKKMSISGRATMVYGKDLYISLRFIGMEVAIVYIDTKSVYVIDKYHKYYFKEDISNLLKDSDITLSDLQDLLLGRAVIPGKGIIKTADAADFSFLASDDQWILTPVKQFKGAEWHYLATKTDPPLLSAVSLRLDGGTAVECRFSEPTSTEAGIADGITTLTMPFNNNNIRVSIMWSLNDARWDTGRTVDFTPPGSQFKRIDIESLMKDMDKF